MARTTTADLLARIEALQARLDEHKAQTDALYQRVDKVLAMADKAVDLLNVVTNDPAKPLPLAHYRALRDAVIAGDYDTAKTYLAAVAGRHGDHAAQALKSFVWKDAKKRGATSSVAH